MVDRDKENLHQARVTTLTLPPRDGVVTAAHTSIPPGLVSPGINVEFHGDPGAKPAPIYIRYVCAAPLSWSKRVDSTTKLGASRRAELPESHETPPENTFSSP